TISGGGTFKGDGGGIYNEGTPVIITNCTISGNAADDGTGGVSNATGNAGITLTNDIIAGNESDISGAFNSNGHNLIGNGTGATITPTVGDQIGTATAPIDPKLGPLQDNGGPTQTQALLPGSPAIDKGAAVTGINTDQRGRFRPADDPTIAPAEGGDNSDIGAFEVQADQSLNISTRARILTGENVLDGGFIVTGTDPKMVLIRGIGPSLGNLHVTGFLMDPVLELHDASGVLASNDNWRDSQEAAIEATGIPPTDDAESAIVSTLSPGEYTAILQGKAGGEGIGLIEIYDLDPAANSTLGNISSRGFVDTGDNVMIGGFILGAGEAIEATALIRAIGPSLASSGVMNLLLDPELELHDENGDLVASDDNWKDMQQAEIEATGLAPTDDREAAILSSLATGAYTAIVRGADETTGVGLVEIYNLH
ncbi:MAG TPA: choice-of-anchor Q domain-containing protein, partial [Terriglobales bacterium]